VAVAIDDWALDWLLGWLIDWIDLVYFYFWAGPKLSLHFYLLALFSIV